MQPQLSRILNLIRSGKIQGIFTASFGFISCYLVLNSQTGDKKLHLLCSSFNDIFDVDNLIEVLQNEVSIVKELPSMCSWTTRDYYGTGIRPTRIKTAPVHASVNCTIWKMCCQCSIVKHMQIISHIHISSHNKHPTIIS